MNDDLRHGTRGSYQAGCRCRPCRRAEAAYRAQLRTKHRCGRPILGVCISPVDARRRVRQLKREGYTAARIATLAGTGRLQLTRSAQMRLSTFLRIRRVARFAMLDGADLHAKVTI